MNEAYKFRIYPTREQEELFVKTFGCCRFIYNIMLEDKIREYKETGKMKKTTPAGYKKQYPWLREVDSLALANVQLHLETSGIQAEGSWKTVDKNRPFLSVEQKMQRMRSCKKGTFLIGTYLSLQLWKCNGS